MKSLRFLPIFTLLLAFETVKADFKSVTEDMCIFQTELLAEKTPLESYEYFQNAEKKIHNFNATIEKNKENALARITKEETLATNKKNTAVAELTAKTKKEKNDAQDKFKKTLEDHNKKLPTLAVEDQQTAIEGINRLKNALGIEISSLEKKSKEKESELETTLSNRQQELQLFREQMEFDYVDTKNMHQGLSLNLLSQSEEALKIAGVNHIEKQEADEFDETSSKPEISWLYSLSQDFTYRANENVMECHNCLDLQGKLKQSFIKASSTTASENLLMVVAEMKKAQTEDDHAYLAGVQECTKKGTSISCRTNLEEFKKAKEALTTRKRKIADAEKIKSAIAAQNTDETSAENEQSK